MEDVGRDQRIVFVSFGHTSLEISRWKVSESVCKGTQNINFAPNSPKCFFSPKFSMFCQLLSDNEKFWTAQNLGGHSGQLPLPCHDAIIAIKWSNRNETESEGGFNERNGWTTRKSEWVSEWDFTSRSNLTYSLVVHQFLWWKPSWLERDFQQMQLNTEAARVRTTWNVSYQLHCPPNMTDERKKKNNVLVYGGHSAQQPSIR